MWSRLILALIASLSAISLLQNNDAVALVSAVATAALSAVNAALGPAGRSTASHVASIGFRHIEARAGELVDAVRPSSTSEGGQHRRPGLTAEVLKEYGDRLVALEAEFDDAYDKAPPINRLHSDGQMRVPWTEWGVKRLEGRAKRQKEVREIQAGSLSQSV